MWPSWCMRGWWERYKLLLYAATIKIAQIGCSPFLDFVEVNQLGCNYIRWAAKCMHQTRHWEAHLELEQRCMSIFGVKPLWHSVNSWQYKNYVDNIMLSTWSGTANSIIIKLPNLNGWNDWRCYVINGRRTEDRTVEVSLIIIMFIFKCYFSREDIALSHQKRCEIIIRKTNKLPNQTNLPEQYKQARSPSCTARSVGKAACHHPNYPPATPHHR